MTVELRVKRLAHASDIPLPAYQSAGAAGADLRAALGEDRHLGPGERSLVPTGFAFEIPDGYELQIRPRSGLAVLHGVTVLNTPGTVDSDYRGEVMVILVNLGTETFTIRRGDRIAQMVLAPVTRARMVEAAGIGTSERGEGGFGSTGV
ncbi:dUTP diphosphatase [Fulvimarina endophytica]